ncbi:MAG: hypothetical protein ABIH47_04450 [Candidatus Omnitrophota bacterium]
MKLDTIFNRKLLLVVIILCIGATLRFYKLNFRSFWYDESSKLCSAICQYTVPELIHHRNIAQPL